MTKKDLKTGMRVTYKNGMTSILIINDYDDDDEDHVFVEFGNNPARMRLCDYSDDLKLAPHRCDGKYDIVKVERSKNLWFIFTNPKNVDWELLWERKEEPEIEEISADEAMRRLEEQSGKKVKIIR